MPFTLQTESSKLNTSLDFVSKGYVAGHSCPYSEDLKVE